jgi:hypothetical protein
MTGGWGAGSLRTSEVLSSQAWGHEQSMLGHPQGKEETMSTSTGPDDELIRERYAASLGEDMTTRLTRGVVDGFTEASEAFSHELEGTNRFPDLMGRSVAGVIRANARLLDELATVVRQMSDGFSVRSQAVANDDLERLADMVARRLRSTEAVPAAAETRESAGGSRKS